MSATLQRLADAMQHAPELTLFGVAVAALAVAALFMLPRPWRRARQPAAEDAAAAEPAAKAAPPSPGPAALPSPAPLPSHWRRTRALFAEKLRALLGRSADAALFAELEALLLGADLGVETANDLLEHARREARGGDGAAVKSALRQAITMKLQRVQNRAAASTSTESQTESQGAKPHVIVVLGVNGSGKTTTIGKLAARYKAQGKRVLLGAGDSFRAAAREQLQAWGARTGCETVAGPQGGDPAAVAFDSIKAAQARGADVAIIDTAGRLQSNAQLMQQLAKIVRVAGRAMPGAPHETLLVLDANTGQNAISQAREFTQAAQVTGLVLTKLDGTAKGGVVVGLADAFGIPIPFIGTGESEADLREFNAEEFVAALFDEAPGAAE